MSRIIRGPIVDGEEIKAGPLNDRFTDFTQTNLNQFNTRDAAIDLPQFERSGQRGFMVPVATDTEIGEASLKHTTSVTLNGQITAPTTPYIIGDASPAPTVLGPLGVGLVNVTTDNVLRVYWHLNVRPKYTGSPWLETDTPSPAYDMDASGGGQQGVFTSGTCWVIYLQWDITSPALTNWTEVPFQGDYRTAITGGVVGDALSDCTAASVVPAWITYSDADDRIVVGSPHNIGVPVGWRSVSGCYYYDASMAGEISTVYGLRLVAKGPMHPYNVGGVNYLVHQTAVSGDTGTDVQLEHTGGRLGIILQRLG
jgi:hypothetical protein